MSPNRAARAGPAALSAANCPVAYQGKGGVRVAVKDMSGLPTGDLYLYYTSNIPNRKAEYQFLNAQGGLTTFNASNAATAFPIAKCFPGSIGKKGGSYFLPLFDGGRLWISFSSNLEIKGAAGGGFVGPSGWSPGPGYNQPWDTVEMSNFNPGIFVNLTRVDMLGLPLQIAVLPSGKSTPFKDVGEVLADYPKILQALASDPPFDNLVKTVPGFSPAVPRILNPSHESFPNVFNDPKFFEGGYMKKVVRYYSNSANAITYNTSYTNAKTYCMGSWKATSDGTNFVFAQSSGTKHTYPVSAYTTAYILSDDPARGGYKADTCAYLLDKILLTEFNRGVATTPHHPMENPAKFYPSDTINNQYACILHKYSLHHATYGFAYDDATNQAAQIINPAPAQIDITIGRIPKKFPSPTQSPKVCTGS